MAGKAPTDTPTRPTCSLKRRSRHSRSLRSSRPWSSSTSPPCRRNALAGQGRKTPLVKTSPGCGSVRVSLRACRRAFCDVSEVRMAQVIIISTGPQGDLHDTGRGHPERAERLRAVERGIRGSDAAEAVVAVPGRPARQDELLRVHRADYLESVSSFVAAGGGAIDPDTRVAPGSWEAALLAAGSGLAAVDALERGEGEAAFVAVRPPGHHATPDTAMGFCLINNVAVTAAALADRGERVLIVDWDVHHGN